MCSNEIAKVRETAEHRSCVASLGRLAMRSGWDFKMLEGIWRSRSSHQALELQHVSRPANRHNFVTLISSATRKVTESRGAHELAEYWWVGRWQGSPLDHVGYARTMHTVLGVPQQPACARAGRHLLLGSRSLVSLTYATKLSPPAYRSFTDSSRHSTVCHFPSTYPFIPSRHISHAAPATGL